MLYVLLQHSALHFLVLIMDKWLCLEQTLGVQLLTTAMMATLLMEIAQLGLVKVLDCGLYDEYIVKV